MFGLFQVCVGIPSVDIHPFCLFCGILINGIITSITLLTDETWGASFSDGPVEARRWIGGITGRTGEFGMA